MTPYRPSDYYSLSVCLIMAQPTRWGFFVSRDFEVIFVNGVALWAAIFCPADKQGKGRSSVEHVAPMGAEARTEGDSEIS
jgi:hypothetical protein